MLCILASIVAMHLTSAVMSSPLSFQQFCSSLVMSGHLAVMCLLSGSCGNSVTAAALPVALLLALPVAAVAVSFAPARVRVQHDTLIRASRAAVWEVLQVVL